MLRVDGARLGRHLDALARIGAIDGGGVQRLAFTEVDKAARDYVEARMQALGLTTYVDGIGNLFGVRAGAAEGPLVLMGSHTDTVAAGGRFDGSLGVLAALEVVEVLNERGVVTERPTGVASFVNEEGVRFMPDMMGSLVFSGRLSVEAARAVVGTDGTTIGENLDRLGYAGSGEPAPVPPHCFLELHIEQGPVLEAEGLTIGIVEGVQGLSWSEYRLRGVANHAGVTPMALRRDAGYAAAAIVQFARALARDMGGGQRATVGSLTLHPNVVNVIPGEAVLTVDLRNPAAGRLAEAEGRVDAFVAELAVAEGVDVTHRRLARVDPVAFDAACVTAVEQAAVALGYPARRLVSGAGHDAQIMAGVCPTAMIFIPSRGGISHNPQEYSSPEHVEAGANVLLHAVLAHAGTLYTGTPPL